MLSRTMVRSTLSAMLLLLWVGVPDRCHGDRPLGTVASGSRPRGVVSGHQFQGHQSVDGGLGQAGVRPSPAGPGCVQDALLGGGQGLHDPVSYTHLRAHETKANLVCRLLLEKKKK